MNSKLKIVMFCVAISVVGLNGCEKTKNLFDKKIKKHNTNASNTNFKIDCPGKNSQCSGSQVTVKNISKQEFDDLVVVCKDKKNPDAPPDKPYYTLPFSLKAGELRCIDALDNCMREKVKNINTGKTISSYVTLLQIDSNQKPIWKQYQDCK